MDVTDRFAKLWERWDGDVGERSQIPAYLARATDEDLVELLAAASAKDRKYERDVIATEVLNRLHRRQNDLPAAAAEVLRSAHAAYEAATKGQRAIHTAEGILKAHGDEELGADVSASAYASLDTTRLAFEAAQQNSADVEAAISRSRIAQELAQDAAKTAERTGEATREAAGSLAASGHKHEAKQAQKAADEITDAANATVEALAREREAEGDDGQRGLTPISTRREFQSTRDA
ncbi:MAG TPA: hypothetical protein VM370_12080 [Candidatus Thermoplasmatota archaeon]|nr:hypothetical protein [Candidatus Thermoplasmatota archaeon]